MGAEQQTGTRLGGYLLGDVLGRGGMGVVYRAIHVHLGREVALKVLAPELSGYADFRERFLRESRLAASLDHPNVVTVYDAGDFEGTLYIAMRYVEGTDLAKLLRREGPLEPATALGMLDQVGAGLDAAHSRGLIHRDVKPGNVLIASGHCYLTDFGLTKRARAGEVSEALTRSGQFLGTVDYVAPEQIEGRAIDARTDIYALKCMLHECLTGARPFQKESEMAVIFAHLADPPPLLTLSGTSKQAAQGAHVVGGPIRVGKAPFAIAFGLGSAWVTNRGDDTVMPLDASTGEPIGSPIPVGRDPTGIAVIGDSV